MKSATFYLVFALLLSLSAKGLAQETGEWVSLFNGKNFDGRQVGENAATFTMDDGAIKVAGDIAHLFYVGDVALLH